ncbi:hypothetical protein IWZ03DRAFT_367682 [Phyllosticta citriasiana]|uniref:Galactose oxidase n=1 Tax=Phyllosticta citriasiana TaxID=595635 RepID=A0ABR1L2Z3_9PEZI
MPNFLSAAGNLVQGALSLAKGERSFKATFAPIQGAPLPRTGHSISVIKGRAYVFGGEDADGLIVDNDMHVIILPSSGVQEADYYSIKAKPAAADGPVPAPRKGHSASVVGDDIFIYGGVLSEDYEQEAEGVVWVFSPFRSTWTALHPSNAALPTPAPRSHHAFTATEEPRPKESTPRQQPNLPQQPPDPSLHVPEPPAPGSWGTLFISCGATTNPVASGAPIHDLWTFDIRTRTWTSLAAPPGPARIGAAMAMVGTRIYLIGGSNGPAATPDTSGGGNVVPSELCTLDVSGLWKFAEAGGPPARTQNSHWEILPHEQGEGPDGNRTGASLIEYATGHGRHYLLLVGGGKDQDAVTTAERELRGLEEPPAYWDDMWVYQLPATAGSGAGLKDATRRQTQLETREGLWAEVLYQYVNEAGDVVRERPLSLSGTGAKGMGSRMGFAAARGTEVEGASVIVWGGVDELGKAFDDGWMIAVSR